MVAEKVEDKELRDYELVFIVSPALADEGFDAMIERVNQFITRNGGVASEVVKWGKKKLAYPIKHFLEGNYALSRFKLRPRFSRELESNLRLSEDILRYLLIKVKE